MLTTVWVSDVDLEVELEPLGIVGASEPINGVVPLIVETGQSH